MTDNISENETVEVSFFPEKAFSMQLPLQDAPDEMKIMVTVIYRESDGEKINAEAWLSSNIRFTMKFLGDVFEFDRSEMTENEIEDKIVNYIEESETFSASVKALINEDYDYFVLTYSPKETESFKNLEGTLGVLKDAIKELENNIYQRNTGIIEYLDGQENKEETSGET